MQLSSFPTVLVKKMTEFPIVVVITNNKCLKMSTLKAAGIDIVKNECIDSHPLLYFFHIMPLDGFLLHILSGSVKALPSEPAISHFVLS